MHRILFLLCIFLSIKFVHNTQCTPGANLVGYCGCCPIIGGSCIYLETIDGLAMSWHLCVPENRKKTFSLEECIPKPIMDKNLTRICRTKNETFRLFPQCATKEVCQLRTTPRNFTPQCHTPMAVKGTCDKSIKRFSYDSKRRECVPFTYSGCGGSTNRFVRLDRCQKLCIKPAKTN